MAPPPHPLKAATLSVERLPPGAFGPPKVPPALREHLVVDTHPVGEPRLIGDLVGAIDREGRLHCLQAGEHRSWPSPGQSFFDIAPDGTEAWVTRREDGRVYTARLNQDAPVWTPIVVHHLSMWGLDGVARLDADHIVVKSDKTLELLQRPAAGSGGDWVSLHRVAVPAEAPLRPFRGHEAVLLCSQRRLLIYGRKGPRLTKLNEAALDRHPFSRMLPSTWFDPEGALWLDNGYAWAARLQ